MELEALVRHIIIQQLVQSWIYTQDIRTWRKYNHSHSSIHSS